MVIIEPCSGVFITDCSAESRPGSPFPAGGDWEHWTHDDVELLVGGRLCSPRSDGGAPGSTSSLTALRGRDVLSTAAPPVDPPPDDEPSPLVVSVVLDTRSDPRWVSASEEVIPSARPKPPADDAEEEDIVKAKRNLRLLTSAKRGRFDQGL